MAGRPPYRRLHPHVDAAAYRDITTATSAPIHTGEQLCLRQNFVDLIEKQAVRVLGPDPADVGGLAELKWIAEYADLHGIGMAPHGTGDGVLGLAALIQVSAILPANYIAFEYPVGNPDWWYDTVGGLSDAIVTDGLINVGDAPVLAVTFRVEEAKRHLTAEDARSSINGASQLILPRQSTGSGGRGPTGQHHQGRSCGWHLLEGQHQSAQMDAYISPCLHVSRRYPRHLGLVRG